MFDHAATMRVDTTLGGLLAEGQDGEGEGKSQLPGGVGEDGQANPDGGELDVIKEKNSEGDDNATVAAEQQQADGEGNEENGDLPKDDAGSGEQDAGEAAEAKAEGENADGDDLERGSDKPE